MSNTIKSSDIFDEDIFKVLVDGAEEAKKKIALLNTELVKVGTSFKSELGGSKTESIKDIDALLTKSKQLNAEVEKQVKLNTAQAELNRNYRLEEIRLQKAREKAVDDFNRKEQKDQERANKELEKRLKKEKDLADAYKQLTINTRDLKNESKRLGAEMLELEKQGKKNSVEYYKLSKQYKETTTSAIEGDKALKKLDSTVGDNFRNVGNYEKAVGKFKDALTKLGLAFGVFDGIRSLIDTQIKLDSLNLALKNVSGSTKEYQANFAFLKDVSRSYGQDLLVLIDSYKNFISSTSSSNLSLTQRKRIYESVVKAGSSLALSNDEVKGSLLAISQMFSKGVVSAEELRQQLGERLPGAFGIMAESMGVSEQELGKLMKNGQVLADDVMPRFGIMLEKHFGKNAEERLKTLGGAWNLLKTNITLYFDQAQKNININKTLSYIIKTLGENIGSVLRTFKDLTIAFVTYKAGVLGAELVTRLLNGTLFRVQGNLTRFAQTLKTVGWVGVALVLVELTNKFIELANQIDITRKNYEKWKASTNQGSKNAKDFIDLKNQELNKYKEDMELLKDAGKINQEEFNKRMKLKKEELNWEIREKATQLYNHELVLQKKLDKIKSSYIEDSKNKIKSAYGGKISKSKLDELVQVYGETEPTLPKLSAIEGMGLPFVKMGLFSESPWYKQKVKEFEDYQKIKKELNRAITKREGLSNYLNEEDIMSTKFTGKGGTASKDTLERTKELRDLNTEYNQTNEYLSRQVELLKDIDALNAENKLQETIDRTAKLLSDEEKKVNLTGDYNQGAVMNAVNAEYDARKKHEEKRFNTEIEDRKIRDEKLLQDELEAIKKQEDSKLKNLSEIQSDTERKLNDAKINSKKKNLNKASKQQYEAEVVNLKGQIELNKQFAKEIESGAVEQRNIALDNKLKREQDANTEIEKLEIIHQGNLENIKRDSQNKIDEELYKLELIKAEKRLERIKNTAEAVNNIIQKSLEHYVRLAERRMDILDKRMERMSTQADFLRDKAVAGSIQAQESLAVIDKQQIENEKQRLNEQRSIQRLQMAMAVFQAYSNNIQNAKVGENPFTKTLTDITLLNQFVASLPTFIDGTETNIAESLGKAHMQGQDGYIVRVDGSEKVLNPKLSAMTGNMTTYEIAKLAEDFRRGEVMRKGEGAMQLNVGSWGTDMIVSELQDLKNVIKNKPENQVEVAEILNGVMHIVETKKSGNTKVRNISRFS